MVFHFIRFSGSELCEALSTVCKGALRSSAPLPLERRKTELKNVLVMGGSYFLGRIFCIFASRGDDMELTLVNRGRYAMTQYPHLTEHRCDRHDALGLERLPEREYDAAVDLCAYAPGDISLLLEHLPGTVKQYILISTADVYDRKPEEAADEDFPLRTALEAGTVGEYIRHKCLLEEEARRECEKRGIALTVLRPAFIYGPFNYAPRESWYVQRIVRGEEIPVPGDAAARFQFVFVKDAAEAILACIRQPGAANRAYNLAAPEVLDYPAFMAALAAASDRPFTTREVTVEEVLRENIPLPFPLAREESELFRGDRITRELGLAYTPFGEGLATTFKAFRSVYE